MGRIKEVLQTIKGFLHAVFSPIFQINDIPKEFDPHKKTFLQNKKKHPTKNSITMISWNILRNYNKEKIKTSLMKIMKEQKPQIIFIQEAPMYNDSSFWENKSFEEFNKYYAPLHQVKKQDSFYNFAHTGQLTLSRYPFTKTRTYQLPSVSRQFLGKNHIIKRVALYTQIKIKEKTIGTYNIHLENAAWQSGRKKQIEFLLEKINKNNDDIVFIGGDFNTFLSGVEESITTLQKAGFKKLLSNIRILPRLDHLFVKGSEAKGTQLQGTGSDHQPVMATLQLNTSRE